MCVFQSFRNDCFEEGRFVPKTMRLRLVQLVQFYYTICRKRIVTVLLNMRKHFNRSAKDAQMLYTP